MKKTILICMLATFTFINGFSLNMFQGDKNDPDGTLKITCTQDLAGLVGTIQNEYTLNKPGTDFNISVLKEGESAGMDLSKAFLLTSASANTYSSDGAWSVTVGRDILVPVINRENPYYSQLAAIGLKPSAFKDVLAAKGNCTWGAALGSESTTPLAFYMDDSEVDLSRLGSFAGINSGDINSSQVEFTGDVIKKVSANKNALGFCRLIDILGADMQSFSGVVQIVPIDQNENGILDHFENYHRSYGEFNRAVWIGKYPKSLYNEVRLVSEDIPVGEAEIEFIEWVLTSGQEQLTASGFTELVPGEVRTSMNRIYAYDTELKVENATYANVGRAFLWILGFLGLVLLSGLVVLLASKKTASELVKENVSRTLDPARVNAPQGVLFDKSFTWSYMEKDGMVRVGASDFLQHITGKISRIIPKDTGESVKRGEPMFTIVQDGKHLVVYSPVSGIIKNVNSDLSADSTAINKSPYNEGWIYEVEPSKWMSEYRSFLMGDTYKEWLSKEVVRLKEFMNNVIFKKYAPELQPILQDGGEVVDKLLEEMGPDMWEEFQLGFIDKAF